MKCLICLSNRARIKYCCVYVHKKCQKKWGSSCIICKKNTGIYTKNKYVYIPPPEEFTDEEIRIQQAIERRIERQRLINQELLQNGNTILDMMRRN